MRSMKILSAALLLSLAGAASAGTSSGTMQVGADAINTCYIQAANLDFGQVPAVINTTIDGVGNIDLQCSPNTSWQISADGGLGGGGPTAPGQRWMNAAGEYLSYWLYTDQTRSTGLFGFDQIIGNSGPTGGVQQVPVYASINSGQIVSSNWYSDTVGLTVEFN